MAKAKSKKQNNRVDPISKTGKEPTEKAVKAPKEPKEPKEPKASHLYTDDNPETSLQGTGFKDAAAADKTISLVSERSLLYQWQVINTMYNRAKHHPKKTKDMEAAIGVFERWLKETYREAKADQRVFKPLPKKTVEAFLPELRAAEGVDTTFAEMYVRLEGRKRLANVLVDDGRPEGSDWDRARLDALSRLVPDRDNQVDEDELWEAEGVPSQFHLSLLAWAWSPLSDYKLLKATNKG